jgi:tripartite-type tricarboxylate transporter receptor subunit TctC
MIMTLARRTFLRLSASAAAMPALARSAHAQTYPSRPVRIVVGFAPGGATDILARIAGQWLTTRLGQQFIVENRSGANGNLATEGIVNAPADGHSLLMIAPANTINATLFDNLTFNFIRDIAPVAGMLRTFYVMVVNPSFPAKTVPEFIAYAKANRGKISYASAGAGTPQHVSAELFKMLTGVEMQHVPYRGSIPGLTDLIGGQVQVMFDNMATALEHVRSGRLRALGVTTATRAPALPEVPTIGEFVPGFDVSAQFGIGAPRNTPAAVIQTLNREINAGLADPAIRARLDQLNGVVTAATPAEFGKLIADEAGKWAKVIKFAGIKAD